MSDVETFATGLVDRIDHGEPLDPDVRAQLIEDMVETIDTRLNARILEELPESKYAAFGEAMDRDAGHEFLAENLPNLDAIITSELAEFERRYLRK